MSSSANNFMFVQRSLRPENESDVRLSYNVWNRAPRHLPYRSPDMSTQDPWSLFEDRVRSGPYRLNGFPSHPHSPIRIIVLNDEIARSVNPRLRQFIRESPPRIRRQWNVQPSLEHENESRSTQDDRNKAMMNLKKQIYNPYTKNRNTSRWSLYYRETPSHNRFNTKEEEKSDDEDGKSCTICLEDFVPKEEVVLTPCKHMFHEYCIVRWVKSHAQCPVCRSTIGEGRQDSESRERMSHVHNNNVNVGDNEVMPGDLISLIRAMEEAFQWVNVSR
ncbi:hypothetical protein GIB67_022410 [Kingdonia uniflora]|uniref:RING-type E3 ubiquitin transferase n=1 Tax=Kingdonia uniflora TaxID=39325 RepID=A0A7J7MU78_9MAGN|nr:hypothetical protein GIB67_022410 [Kingdonia uniflora]